jgi:hypothetical protein
MSSSKFSSKLLLIFSDEIRKIVRETNGNLFSRFLFELRQNVENCVCINISAGFESTNKQGKKIAKKLEKYVLEFLMTFLCTIFSTYLKNIKI